MRFPASTVDDILRQSYETIRSSGTVIEGSRRGPNQEVIGVQIELSNPRARLSLSESRATLFSCVGELFWYLAGSDDIEFIKYYAPQYDKFVKATEDGRVPAAYGPRLFSWGGINQVANIIDLLREHPDSKQAAIQIFDRNDMRAGARDVPCTCTLQYMIRGNRLEALTTMRSNDAVRGLPHDLFSFTMLQEFIASALNIDVGSYRHSVASLHIYKCDMHLAEGLISEGWQATVGASMPPMPPGSAWPKVVEVLLEAERAYRVDRRSEPWPSTGVPYWDALIWVLECLRHVKAKDVAGLESAWNRRTGTVFDSFVRQRLQKLKQETAA